MSEWIEIDDKNIEIDKNMKEINILIYNNNSGNVWACLTFDQIEKIYRELGGSMNPGTRVRFSGNVGDAQVNWGSHDDPRGILIPGNIYTVDHTEVHSWHTKVFLIEHPGSFNSVWFEEV